MPCCHTASEEGKRPLAPPTNVRPPRKALTTHRVTPAGVWPLPPPPTSPSPLPAATSCNKLSPPRDSDPGASRRALREKKLHAWVMACEAGAPRGAHGGGTQSQGLGPEVSVLLATADVSPGGSSDTASSPPAAKAR